MKNPEEDLDEILARGLRQKLDGTEAVVAPSLYTKISKRLKPSGKKTAWIILLLLMMLGIVSETGNESAVVSKQTIGRVSGTLKVPGRVLKKYPALTHKQDCLQKNMKVIRWNLGVAEKRFRKSANLTKEVPDSKPQNEGIQLSVANKAAMPAIDESLSPEFIPAGNLEALRPSKGNDKTDQYIERGSFGSSFSMKHDNQESREMVAMGPVDALTAPGYQLMRVKTQVPEIHRPALEEKYSNPRTFKWLLVVSAMQNFQILKIYSQPSEIYQNIRFSSVLTQNSKTLKFGAGVEIKGFQVLANYGYFQNRVYYETGASEYEIKPVTGGEDQIFQRGVPKVLDEKVQSLGVGVNKSFLSKDGLLRRYEVIAGLQYTCMISQKQKNLVAINTGLLRRLNSSANMDISIGPTLEFGLIQRRLHVPGWKYRPYQIGIAATFKLKD